MQYTNFKYKTDKCRILNTWFFSSHFNDIPLYFRQPKSQRWCFTRQPAASCASATTVTTTRRNPPPTDPFLMAPPTAATIVAGPFLAAAGALEREKLKLQASIVRTLAECTPGWAGVRAADVDVTHVGGAMTNLIFAVTKPEGENADVLIRIYGEGTDSFFVRHEETRLFELLSSKNIGVKLLGEFGNGRVEKLLTGSVCTRKQIRQPELSAQIARKMHEFHHIDVDIDRAPRILSEIHRLLEVARKKCTGAKFQGVDLAGVAQSIQELEGILAEVPSPLVLSHNDLQYGNIMNTETGVVLIDFEYTSYNPRGYDLGNHFCEWMYDYHRTVNPHLADFAKYPTAEQQRHFCRAYLSAELGDDARVSDEAVEALRREANAYSLAAHLFWGIWGFIQASQSEIDFDFLAYGQCRYDAFVSRVTFKS